MFCCHTIGIKIAQYLVVPGRNPFVGVCVFSLGGAVGFSCSCDGGTSVSAGLSRGS